MSYDILILDNFCFRKGFIMKNKALSIIIGLLAIALGIGYGLKALDFEYFKEFTIFFDGWWTLFLIVPGIVSLFNKNSKKTFGIFVTSLGIILLLQQRGLFDTNIKKLILALL